MYHQQIGVIVLTLTDSLRNRQDYLQLDVILCISIELFVSDYNWNFS